MLPLSRRRARRRSISRRLVTLLLGGLVLALLIGGLTRVAHESVSYDASADRSLAAQGTVVANESTATAVQLRHLLTNMQTLDRRTLQADLDSLVQQTTQQSDQAVRAAQPAPAASLGGMFTSVFADRAGAVSDIRGAIDGLLGMHPLPIAGAPTAASTAGALTLLTSTQASDRITAAGALLQQADSTYGVVRRDLRRSTGRARLPVSVWVTDAATWGPGAVAAQVDLISASASLSVAHYLKLQTVRLDPPALPPAPTTAQGTSVLSPTSSISVTVTIVNLGSVDEPHGAVQVTLTPQSGGSTVMVVRRADVLTGGSVTLPTVTFQVSPGHGYQLTVSIVPPSGQASDVGTTESQILEIAPGT